MTAASVTRTNSKAKVAVGGLGNRHRVIDLDGVRPWPF